MKIKNCAIDNSISLEDKLIGSDVDEVGKTKQYSIRAIRDFLIDDSAINTEFQVVAYASTISRAFNQLLPNIQISLTGNLDLTITGTVNGD